MNGAESLVRTLLTLARPSLGWVALAQGHGVEGCRAATLEALADQLRRAFARRGPCLVEAVL